jgi:FtsZ-binding cell division protein ZapB
MDVQVWVPLFVAIVGPLGLYLGLRRRLSGQVQTSDADTLWKESSEMRAMLTNRVTVLESRLDTLGEKLNDLVAQAIRLQAEKDFLERENKTLKDVISGGKHDPPVS